MNNLQMAEGGQRIDVLSYENNKLRREVELTKEGSRNLQVANEQYKDKTYALEQEILTKAS